MDMNGEDLEGLSRDLFQGVIPERLRKATKLNDICIRTGYRKVCSMLRVKRVKEPSPCVTSANSTALCPDRKNWLHEVSVPIQKSLGLRA
jgi:hypothetical protein